MSETATPAPGSTNEALALVGKYGAKARQHAIEAKQSKEGLTAAQKEIADLKAANAKLTGDLDAAVKARGTPDEKDATIAELRAEITTGKHRSAFARAAKAAGVREDAVDDLYTALGYKAEGDPDDAKITAAITGAKAAKGWAWAQQADPPAGGAGQQQQQQQKQIPGAGRGGQNTGGDGTIITREQRADPMFMLNPANQALIKQAAKEGRFRD